jgi:hypothetical protein
MQTIVTHGTSSLNTGAPGDSMTAWKSWKNTLKIGLGPTVTVFGDSEDAASYLRPWSLAKAWSRSLAEGHAAGSHEVSLGDMWDWSDRWNGIKALMSP